ncbi:MAG TPA: metallophosphoesterase [Candidatus Nanoarchaeia archaeon]|nr:metallophosphoesterase [Candidatus Nanoarchaeia archaeon]
MDEFCFEKTMNKILELQKGKCMIINDVHGNWKDYQQVKKVFLELIKKDEADCLVINGDMIHAYEGEDSSIDILEDVFELMKTHKVVYLLGNHEFAHVVGKLLKKKGLEFASGFQNASGERFLDYKNFFSSCPLILKFGNVVVSHSGAFNIDELNDEEKLYEALNSKNEFQYGQGNYGNMLLKFLKFFNAEFIISGHIPCSEGFEIIFNKQIRITTGYGSENDKKKYMLVDAEKDYKDIDELASCIRNLY